MRRATSHGRIALLLAGAGLAVSACSTLPSSGPTAGQINEALREDNKLGFTIVDIDPAVTATLAAQPPMDGGIGALARPGRIDALGVGDVLTINVYEVGVTLFSGASGVPGQTSFNPSARATPIDNVLVERDGTVTLPYVGRVKVAGKSPAEVARIIERGLRGLSQRPQVQVAVKTNTFNNYYVSGAVRLPGRFPLALPEERLLDALARAGGSEVQPDDLVIRLTRGGTTAETRYSSVTANSSANIPLLPGDRVEIVSRPRTYLAFGSTLRVSQVPFSAAQVSLAEAIARIAGPNEASADASAVYLFRYDETTGQAGGTPVVYRLNMLRADSYFLSQRIGMRDKDVIYIASAASNQPGKLAQILGQLFTPIIAARAVTR